MTVPSPLALPAVNNPVELFMLPVPLTLQVGEALIIFPALFLTIALNNVLLAIPTVILEGEIVILETEELVSRSPQPDKKITANKQLATNFTIAYYHFATHDGAEDFTFELPPVERGIFAFGGEL